jgi:hypothetical protein
LLTSSSLSAVPPFLVTPVVVVNASTNQLLYDTLLATPPCGLSNFLTLLELKSRT